VSGTAPAGGERLRVTVLWQGMSGYTRACFAALADLGAEVRVVHSRPTADAPFAGDAIVSGLHTTSWQDAPDADALEADLDAFDPHVLLVSSWHIHPYRRAARRRRGRTLRVLCMDNQWWGTAKQWLGVATAPWAVRPAYDAAFLPGERQADFAHRLGFSDERIIRGMYSADHGRFAAVATARGDVAPPPAFVYVGRLVTVKGIDVLAEGYRRYRARATDPWPLVVGGTGPEAGRFAGMAGVEALGFVQPDDLPSVLARAGCLVLPSRFEPWGVVIHEAAAAGLAVVCTSVCGAASRLVLEGYNGAVVSPGAPDALAGALARIAAASDGDRLAMSRASRALARQFTPDRWARHLVARAAELRAMVGLPPAPVPVPGPSPRTAAL
jgi:glycosyltransferase involved in cell wall biosynthesis